MILYRFLQIFHARVLKDVLKAFVLDPQLVKSAELLHIEKQYSEGKSTSEIMTVEEEGERQRIINLP